MRTLTQHLNEKLIINRNYKNVDDIKSLFDNVKFERKFERDEYNEFETRDDIFTMMVDYIHDNNVRSFSDFDSYKKIGVSDSKSCLALFNKRIEELYIFQKIAYDTYYCFIICISYLNNSVFIFKRKIRSFSEMSALKNVKVWTNTDVVEYYEISKETFNDLSKLYDKLGRK